MNEAVCLKTRRISLWTARSHWKSSSLSQNIEQLGKVLPRAWTLKRCVSFTRKRPHPLSSSLRAIKAFKEFWCRASRRQDQWTLTFSRKVITLILPTLVIAWIVTLELHKSLVTAVPLTWLALWRISAPARLRNSQVLEGPTVWQRISTKWWIWQRCRSWNPSRPCQTRWSIWWRLKTIIRAWSEAQSSRVLFN